MGNITRPAKRRGEPTKATSSKPNARKASSCSVIRMELISAAIAAQSVGLGLNAGHDLSLENLNYFAKNIPNLLEVSIGHALISDALYFGLENTIQLYLKQLKF